MDDLIDMSLDHLLMQRPNMFNPRFGLVSFVILSFSIVTGCQEGSEPNADDTSVSADASNTQQAPQTQPNMGMGSPAQTQVTPVVSFMKMVELVNQPTIKTYWMKTVHQSDLQDDRYGRTGKWNIDPNGRLEISGFNAKRNMNESQRYSISLSNHNVDPNSGFGSISLLEQIIYFENDQLSGQLYQELRCTLYFSNGSWSISKFEYSGMEKRRDDPRTLKLDSGNFYSEEQKFFRELIKTAQKSP